MLSLLGISGIYLRAFHEDTPDDTLRRWSLTAVWMVVFIFLEAINDFDFVIAPLWRFIANWPARIGHWFTDPARGGVLLEVVFVALVLLWAYRSANRYVPKRAAVPPRTT